MKSPLILLFLFASFLLYAQDNVEESGLPGDHFSLEGALEMFKKANSIEEFEKLINEKENTVNNLDLDENGEVDYISVIDNQDNDAHAFVLRVAFSESENQDIAVIELEKTGPDEALLQIVGDEDIYGETMIVEASDGNDEEFEEENTTTKRGPSDYINKNGFVVVNVWTWPSVRYVYGPVYRPWVSPWHWRHYPTWYRPWRPLSWNVFHPFRIKHRTGFRVVHTHRVVVAHNVYGPRRASSVTLRTRNSKSLSNYRVTRTTRKTTVTGPNGKDHTVKKSKTTVTKKKSKGKKGRKGN